MNYTFTNADKKQWDEFHSEKAVQEFIDMYVSLIQRMGSTVDNLVNSIRDNEKELKFLQDIHDSKPDKLSNLKKEILKTKAIVEKDTKAISAYANVVLIMMDLCTYSNYFFLSHNQWEWRVFARHIYTLFYEHRNSMNKDMNTLFQVASITNPNIEKLDKAIKLKKEFTKWIEDHEKYAKGIRNIGDAHFDGNFILRLTTIENLSYTQISIELKEYWIIVSNLLRNLIPLQSSIQNYTLVALDKLKENIKVELQNLKKK